MKSKNNNNEDLSSGMENGKPLIKIPTDIAGLDKILEGGIPGGCTTLISGGPGTGKTVFGFEFLHHRAKKGEPGVFITFEERADALRRNMATFGWDLNALEKDGKFFLLEARLDPKTAFSGDFDMTALLAVIKGKATAMNARLIVIDAVDMLLYHFNDPIRERNELYALNDWLSEQGFTAIVTVKTSSEPYTDSPYAYMGFMADCVIQLEQKLENGTTSKRLRVIKYRGSDYGKNEYPYTITSNGIEFIPLSSVVLNYEALGGKITSGNRQIDALLDGGFRRGSTILIAGTTGVGKTTLAGTFVFSTCGENEKGLYISFEESKAAILDTMLSAGIDLRPSVDAGFLELMCDMPESIGTEKHLIETFRVLEMLNPRHIVVDAISACKRMGREKSAFDYLVRLIHFCKSRGVTCVLTNQTESFHNIEDISGVGVSSLTDAIVFLRFFEENHCLRRSLLILKTRGSGHSHQYHEYRITDRGLEVVGPLGRPDAGTDGGAK